MDMKTVNLKGKSRHNEHETKSLFEPKHEFYFLRVNTPEMVFERYGI